VRSSIVHDLSWQDYSFRLKLLSIDAPEKQFGADHTEGFEAFTTALACGLWLSAINIKYRDVAHSIPFLTQFWLFVTPVAYPSTIIPEPWRLLYGLNPMVGVIEGFRWALLGQRNLSWGPVGLSALVVSALLISGLFYFRRMEYEFADLV
jgi:lipopolysaccharide transport system permease protein